VQRKIVTGALALALLGGCRDDWRTDLWYSPSHRPQTIPRPEPAHAVSLGALPAMIDIDDTEDIKNPVKSTPASVDHGKRLYAERCACCHGKDGHGGGPVSKFFPPAPDLAYKAIKERTDGRLFGTVSLGGRAMPAQGEGLSAEDRWDLVNYVRVVQAAAPAATPPKDAP
jgi:mono/diheme cytochrome c family protein